ncbi:hypothetical protein MTR67_013022 [Solanum verrucosum]|uniref:DUF4219 domain-containing protein n=1 Tax=Solanum verrucosum TaxID=315347 RepID=A0AAF0QAY9_SOLVR|nr:hypothetical protein MTR67_013022 [Solanum verrucosum]
MTLETRRTEMLQKNGLVQTHSQIVKGTMSHEGPVDLNLEIGTFGARVSFKVCWNFINGFVFTHSSYKPLFPRFKLGFHSSAPGGCESNDTDAPTPLITMANQQAPLGCQDETSLQYQAEVTDSKVRAEQQQHGIQQLLGCRPSMFTGENYHIWVIKMKAYLKALSLWETIESEDDPLPLGPNPTVAQMKIYEDAKSRKPKALTCLHSTLSDMIFTRIMACETPNEVWEKVKEEFDGSDRVRTVKLLTLKREFKVLRMKEGDTVKEYSAKLVEIVNKVRLFGETFPDLRVVEKMMISLLARTDQQVASPRTKIKYKR